MFDELVICDVRAIAYYSADNDVEIDELELTNARWRNYGVLSAEELEDLESSVSDMLFIMPYDEWEWKCTEEEKAECYRQMKQCECMINCMED